MVAGEERSLCGCLACSCIGVVPALWWCWWWREADVGARSSVLSPVEHAAPGWRRGPGCSGQQQVYREAEQAQWRLSPPREGGREGGRHHGFVCSAAWGEGQHDPCGRSLRSRLAWAPRVNLCHPVCSFIASFCLPFSLFEGMKCLGVCALLLFCLVTTQMNSVVVGRVKGESKKGKGNHF